MTKTVFVGVSDEKWYKFKLAGVVWWAFKGTRLENAPGIRHLLLWAFRVRVMSRDMELIEE